MNLDYFDQIWQSNIKKGDNRVLWDNRAEEFNRLGTDERRENIIGILSAQQMLDENSTVLDIGCGPGKFVLEFASRARHVVGVDISPRMLSYAAENAAVHKLENTQFIEMDWDKADLKSLNWQKKFSLVTGIMSPAFWTRTGLEKMIEASNENCFICHFVKSQDQIEDELIKEVLGKDNNDVYGNKGLYCSLNLLWLYNYYPEIAYFDTEKESVQPVEEAANNFMAKYGTKFDLTAAQESEVLNFLKSKAEDGFIRRKRTAKVACIYWRVTDY